MATHYTIGLDLGTSAIKGVLVDDTGNIVADVEKKGAFITPKSGRYEIDPVQHYQNLCSVIKELAEEIDGVCTGIAMAVASGNTLLVDESGEPLTNIISWMDTRGQEVPLEIEHKYGSKEVRQIVGWPCLTTFPLAHLSWLKENCSALYEKASHYAMNSDWLLYKLTGKWAMDHSTATTFHLQNQESLSYHKPFLELLGISEQSLSPLVESGRPVGTLTSQAAIDCGLTTDCVVVSGSFDHPSAACGMGVATPGNLMLSCGTSWVGFFPENSRAKIIELELLCDPFLSTRGGAWGAIFSVSKIDQNINWYVDHLIAPEAGSEKYKIFDNLASKSERGAGGLIIDLEKHPKHIMGSKENISRAVMEAAARTLKHKLDFLEGHGIKFKHAVLVGGPSKSPIWPEIIEYITGIKIEIGSPYAGAYGAALLARNN